MRDTTMAVGRDRLESRFDRLEKFFSRKKRPSLRSSIHSETDLLPRSAEFKPDVPTFPTPSFIRPTSSRMVARVEVTPRSSISRRAQSLPETPSTPRLISLTSSTNSPARSYAPPRIPQRSSSLSTRRSGASLAELLNFNFSDSFTQSEITSLSTPGRRSRSDFKPCSRQGSVSISPKAQPNRKRQLAEHEDDNTPYNKHFPKTSPSPARPFKSFATEQSRYQKSLPVVQYKKPTLEPSPRLVPLPSAEPHEMEMDIEMSGTSPTLDSSRDGPPEVFITAQSSQSHSDMSTSAGFSETDPILQEPTLNDFLSLSDDDIADGHPSFLTQLTAVSTPPTYALPPDPPSLVTSQQPPYKGNNLLTLAPPLSTKPATAAAFEAQRIAAKYKFDLVYVVNLWSTRPGSSQQTLVSRKSSLSSTKSSKSSDTLVPPILSPPATPTEAVAHIGFALPAPLSPDSARTGMTGRLLAAYGLPAIMCPFRISAPVHQKILNSEGWLEYRSESGAYDEFARGYSRSFYTGLSSNAEGQQPIDRGIVFAAYRLPHPDGGRMDSDAEELCALRQDAEALVNMVVDVQQHMTQRQQSSAVMRCVNKAGTAGSMQQASSNAQLLTA